MRIANPGEVQEVIRDYYRQADLWLPELEEGGINAHRVYRLQVLKDDGTTKFHRLRDRINDKETLRHHLMEHTPLNTYFSVSSWLNPSKTSYKTYATDWDGRMHRDKNGFLFSDYVVDCDHRDRQEVERIYKSMLDEGISEDKLQLRFSGNGWHVIIKRAYRNREIEDPIEREKDAYRSMQAFAQKMIDKGFKFDYIKNQKKLDDGSTKEVINSPSADTRRVTKLPNTFTKYGNKSEIVEFDNLYNFTPTQIYNDIQILSKRSKATDFRDRVKAINGITS